MARMKTSRLTPKTTDPKTGARMANPNTPSGSDAGQGATYLSWPEVRGQYQKGKQEGLITKGTRSEVKNYLQGKTNVLSEEFQEPMVKGGNVQYHYSANESVKKPETNDVNLVSKMPIRKAGKASSSAKLAGGKKEKSAEGFFGDYVPSTKGTSNKQLKQFASYASKTGLNESFIAKSKAEIGQYKNEMKSQRKAYAKEGNLAGVKATTADIRQSRNAAKFVGSKNPMDVPGMVTGYRKEQDNAANRNTIKSQVDRLKKLR
jgi:hypothetical protein